MVSINYLFNTAATCKNRCKLNKRQFRIAGNDQKSLESVTLSLALFKEKIKF
jgi:hypothetical protein